MLRSYIDIGVYPTRGSNSFKFYKKGCSGYAIDIGEKKKLWKLIRPRDIFINTAEVQNSYKENFVNFIMNDSYGSATDHVKKAGILKENYNNKKFLKVKASTANQICEKVIKILNGSKLLGDSLALTLKEWTIFL